MSFNNNSYRPGGFGYMPVVTKNIIIINVIMFVATLLAQSKGVSFDKYFGLHYYLAPDFKPHQFITYIFMHQTRDVFGNLVFTHLLFNMLGVFVFGQALEQLWGPKRYLIFYLLTGLGAALAHYIVLHFEVSHVLDLVNQKLSSPNISPSDKSELIDQKYAYLNARIIVGASGSLFGLLGAFGLLFPNVELLIYFLFPVKAKWLVTIYAAIEIYSSIKNNPKDPVAHIAHLGGLVVGIILVLIWRKNKHNSY